MFAMLTFPCSHKLAGEGPQVEHGPDHEWQFNKSCSVPTSHSRAIAAASSPHDVEADEWVFDRAAHAPIIIGSEPRWEIGW